MSNPSINDAQQFAGQLASSLDEVALDSINGGLTPEHAQRLTEEATEILLSGYDLEEGHTAEELKAKLLPAMEILKHRR